MSWKSFENFNLEGEVNTRWFIDTRDFHFEKYEQKYKEEHLERIYKKPVRFIYSKEEVEKHIKRLYEESGGEGDWRMLDLKENSPLVNNWNLKYINIYKLEEGFIICNSSNTPIPKHIIVSPINKEYLNYH